MKFLVDECLSQRLAIVAHERGFPDSTHVSWLGLGPRDDWSLFRFAVEDGFALVTHNSASFVSVVERERFHFGLVCVEVAHGRMSLAVQEELFHHALTVIGRDNLAGQVLEIALADDGVVRVDRFAAVAA